jgi:hypothetical protein
MGIKFTRNDNILYYKLEDVIAGIKREQNGEKVFFFDSNFSQLHFFNYFVETLEEDEKYEDANIISKHIENLFSLQPKNFVGCVDYCLQLVECDPEIEKIFRVTTPQVICAFLYTNFYGLVYDEFFFFYQKNKLLTKLKEELKTDHLQQIIYEIILQVSYRLKQKVGQPTQFEFDNFELLKKDLENFEHIPKDLTAAIDWLVETTQKNGTILEKITFDGSESCDILTCTIFGHVNHILLTSWYLYHEKSPLKIWFETNRKITDPFYMIYYIIRNFVNFILLKYSVDAPSI